MAISMKQVTKGADMKPGGETAAAQTETRHEEPALKGTFVSVLLLGGFLAITWLAVFLLFMARQ